MFDYLTVHLVNFRVLVSDLSDCLQDKYIFGFPIVIIYKKNLKYLQNSVLMIKKDIVTKKTNLKF